MSGIVSGVNYSLLFSNSTSVANITTTMLNTIYNGATVSTAASTGNPITDLKMAQANEATDVAKETKKPEVARDIAAFQKGVANAKDIQTALKNPNVMKVLLTANNLSKYIQYPALAQKALRSDPSDPNSLANKLADTNLLNTTKTFNFAKNGLAALQDPKIIATLSNGYAEVMWRRSLDQATPGLSNALTFLSQASSIKSVDEILGDSVNRTVGPDCPRNSTADCLPEPHGTGAGRIVPSEYLQVPGSEVYHQPDRSIFADHAAAVAVGQQRDRPDIAAHAVRRPGGLAPQMM